MAAVKNSLIILILLLNILCITCDLIKKKPDLKKAQLAEINGNVADAFTLYIDALLKLTSGYRLPDQNRSKFIKSELWIKEVERYQYWVSTSEFSISELSKSSLEGVTKNIQYSPPDNRLLHIKNILLDSNTYAKEWNKTFFAPVVKIDSAHTALRNASFSKHMSFLQISSPKSYSYTIHLLNPSSMRRIEVQLYPESNVTFMVIPGDYYFICKSTVKFESGRVWISPYTVKKLTIPDKSSLITANLITSVSRMD